MVNWIDIVVQIYLMWSILLPLHIIRRGLIKSYFNLILRFAIKLLETYNSYQATNSYQKLNKLKQTVEDKNAFYLIKKITQILIV